MERYSSRAQPEAGRAPVWFQYRPPCSLTSAMGRKWLLPLHGGSCFTTDRQGPPLVLHPLHRLQRSASPAVGACARTIVYPLFRANPALNGRACAL